MEVRCEMSQAQQKLCHSRVRPCEPLLGAEDYNRFAWASWFTLANSIVLQCEMKTNAHEMVQEVPTPSHLRCTQDQNKNPSCDAQTRCLISLCRILVTHPTAGKQFVLIIPRF